ncbi:hypothetical protein [Lederbergia citri]|uniref:Uncharacterized protein n=1 Tax=Lederbergia citri TaxID=2833580 RepID=A0A942T8X6_9BACI|nr:hypothetical protein [Lederbergia citri]MBS4193466.1 hypothetical protein [Lederbergia citri]
MGFFKDAMKKQTSFEVIGGQNLFNKAMANIYKMVSEEKEYGEGVVKVKGKLYYFLGAHKEERHTRSAGKAAAGAIIGGVLTGGLGAIAGAAIGGRRKDDSSFWMDFADYETKQEFSVQVKQGKGHVSAIKNFRVANPVNIGLEK